MAFAVLTLACRCAAAQQIAPYLSPPPPPEAPVEPVFDPYHAAKSIEIGNFYMKKGNYDAAIDRFEEATRYQPKLAKPWALLGDAYEKKHDWANAAASYRRYLEVFPGAPDAASMNRRIAALLQEKPRNAKHALR